VAAVAQATRYDKPDIVSEVERKWDEAKGHHDAFVKKYERGEDHYKGILRATSNAAKWRHKVTPMYAHNLLETVISNTVEMGLRFDVRPAPHSNVGLEEAMHQLAQAESISDLLRHEHRVDEMDFKQRPAFLVNAIGGRAVLKNGWNYVEGAVRRQAIKTVDVHDADGTVVLQVPTITEIEESGVLRDHSTSELIHPADFVIHPQADSLDPFVAGGAQHCFNRCWYSFEQLKMMEKAGYLKNVDLLKDTQDFAKEEYRNRNKEVWSGEEKDVIEVLEYWCFKGGAVWRCLVGNRTVLLRGSDPKDTSDGYKDLERSPFWHGGFPFTIISSMPQPFGTVGTSEIEIIAALQEILWELGNQTLDNVELINNFITIIRSDVEDPDANEIYPGARWEADGDVNSAFTTFQPPYQLAAAAQQHMGMIKGDLQTVTSATPFAGGADSQTVDNKTATGASIVMSAAQQRMLFKKYCAQQGLRQEANMRIKNCQQFISPKKLVHVVGHDGAMTFREIEALDIQGEYVAELEPMGESQMREQRRAESSQWFQMMMAAAPIFAAAQKPINLEELLGWTAKKWDIPDWKRFMSKEPAAMGAVGAGGPPGGGGAPPPGEAPGPNMGITSDTAVDAGSPSTTGGNSLSGTQMLSRALSMGGGSNNT
jgi:hypothetical protein